MSNELTDGGGPAFPSEWPSDQYDTASGSYAGTPGMTLRDYFAGQALLAFTLRWEGLDGQCDEAVSENHKGTLARIAISSYAAADAMLAEREKDHV